MSRDDKRQGSLADISADAPIISVWISNIIQIWDRRRFVAVEIQKTLCGTRSIENLIESTFLNQNLIENMCFNLKFS